jgi:hypothetical protein
VPERTRRARFRAWWRGTKPADVFGMLSVLIAVVALVEAGQVTRGQFSLERQTEELSAPVLAPGSPPTERGQRIVVSTEYGSKLDKRADRLLLQTQGRARLVIPAVNGGAGIALTVGLPVVVEDCATEPGLLPAGAVSLQGTYVIPSGGSDQLGFLSP